MAVGSSGPLAGTEYPEAVVTSSAETIRTTSGEIYVARVDNSANDEASYLKLYETSPTVGTTDPIWIIKVDAGEVREVTFNCGLGINFTKLYVACTKEAGTAGSTSPDFSVRVKIWTNN